MEYTYEFPDANAFLYTLRRYLEIKGNSSIAALLIDTTCGFRSTGEYSGSGGRWNEYIADFTLWVPLHRIDSFDEEVCKQIQIAADKIFPAECGYSLYLNVQVQLADRPPEDGSEGINNGAFSFEQPVIQHDGLRFRSQTEIRIYDALKRRKILFFPNAAAVLGGTNLKREPDFLICQNGKWGLLEVMGEIYHPSATKDHERARLFKEYGLIYVEFYDAARCYHNPDEVVQDFLKRLL
ncbi:MAG TPA: hypothetical protein VMV29_01545 [Ktedonobacterales bacterium]|nr:hypothetical protein [Ktedonobacterales bacterium]